MSKKLAVAYYNLLIMLEAGMPMLKALDTTAAGLKGKLKKSFSALLFVEFCRWLVRVIYFLICAFLAIQVLIMGFSAYGGRYGMI